VLFLSTELLEPVAAFENHRNQHIAFYRTILDGLLKIGAAYVVVLSLSLPRSRSLSLALVRALLTCRIM